MERLTPDMLPSELREENYHYPAELFDDWGDTMVLRFEGGDDITIPRPVTASERIVLMAKFATAQALRAGWQESTVVSVARGLKEKGFLASVRKAWWSTYKSYGGLERGDVELAAEELGVYELIWPFDPAKMQAAAETEQAIREGRVEILA